MKRIFFAVIFIITYINGQAQQTPDPAFIKIMETHLSMMDTAKDFQSYQQLGNAFERIANAAASQWEPQYYAGFCYAVLAFQVKDKSQVDVLADKADAFLDKADKLNPSNSEISTLRAMITNTRILVDPANRWRELSASSAEWLAKAKQQDAANPRPYYVEARTKLYTPAMLGGGPEAALPILEEAINRFREFKPATSIAPNWGNTEAQKLLAQLKK
ncbi:MAG: hypothetical protein ACTHMC_25615 [Pseudobacter sp.]|uniref:hypothetical protein n=1 Tax=Pseudobacter sp. TaxID=2045420 RepID=UPI003F7D1369